MADPPGAAVSPASRIELQNALRAALIAWIFWCEKQSRVLFNLQTTLTLRQVRFIITLNFTFPPGTSFMCRCFSSSNVLSAYGVSCAAVAVGEPEALLFPEGPQVVLICWLPDKLWASRSWTRILQSKTPLSPASSGSSQLVMKLPRPTTLITKLSSFCLNEVYPQGVKKEGGKSLLSFYELLFLIISLSFLKKRKKALRVELVLSSSTAFT